MGSEIGKFEVKRDTIQPGTKFGTTKEALDGMHEQANKAGVPLNQSDPSKFGSIYTLRDTNGSVTEALITRNANKMFDMPAQTIWVKGDEVRIDRDGDGKFEELHIGYVWDNDDGTPRRMDVTESAYDTGNGIVDPNEVVQHAPMDDLWGNTGKNMYF